MTTPLHVYLRQDIAALESIRTGLQDQLARLERRLSSLRQLADDVHTLEAGATVEVG
jgi:prefoldin subunit 5